MDKICVVPENIHTHPMKGHWKLLGGGGLSQKFIRESSEIPGGGRFQMKNLPWGRYRYFLEPHIRTQVRSVFAISDK